MQTQIVSTLQFPKVLTGLCVVIDVFRAFTTALHVTANGCNRILPVDTLEKARALRHAEGIVNPVLLGERECLMPEDFDHGNSPALIENVDFSGRDIIMTTSAGTRGLYAASESCDEVFTASFANVSAVVAHLQRRRPEKITLLACGYGGTTRAAEDDLCAMYIKNALEGFPNHFEAIARHLQGVEGAEKFFDAAREYAPERDFTLCTALDQFDFILALQRDKDGNPVLVRQQPGYDA